MGETDFLVFPNIDPIIVSLGPLSVRWYGMMYLLGFIAAYLLAKKRLPIRRGTATNSATCCSGALSG